MVPHSRSPADSPNNASTVMSGVGEAEEGDTKYTDAIGLSITLFLPSGNGSLYGKAESPMDFKLLKDTVINNGYISWAAPEFFPYKRNLKLAKGIKQYSEQPD